MQIFNGWFQVAVALLAIAGLVLNIRRQRACFIVWSLTDTCWFVIDWTHGIYAQAILQIVYLVTNVYGWIEWRKAVKPYNDRIQFDGAYPGTLPGLSPSPILHERVQSMGPKEKVIKAMLAEWRTMTPDEQNAVASSLLHAIECLEEDATPEAVVSPRGDRNKASGR